MRGSAETDHRAALRAAFAGGIAAQFLTIGVARFAYTPLLPVMQAEAGLDPRAGGWLGSAIYLGYITATVALSLIAAPALRLALYRAGLVLAVLSTLAMALTQDPLLWALSRFAGGLTGAAGMLLASEFILQWMRARDLPANLGPHFAGLGGGIAMTGCVSLLAAGQLSWRGQWLAFALIALALLPLAWRLVPRPAPRPRPGSPAAGTAGGPGITPLWFALFGLSYLTAGWGYSVGATFTVAILSGQGSGSLGAGAVWILLGLASAAGAILGSVFARRIGAQKVLAACFPVQILSLLALCLPGHPLLAMLAAVLFGGTFIAIVSLSLTLVGLRTAGDPGAAMARVTLLYGAGQVIGPAVTGQLLDRTGGYVAALVLAAAAMSLGFLCLLLARRH